MNNKKTIPHFCVIGDVHGRYKQYFQICENTEYSLQVGDMSYDYDSLKSVDPTRHRFFGGNHDDYSMIPVDLNEDDPEVNDSSNHYIVKDRVYKMNNFPPHSLGQWGKWRIPEVNPSNELGLSGDIFFVRGAWSIDQKYRTEGVDWFREEELNYFQSQKALDDYAKEKPDFVVTHCVPYEILSLLKLDYSDGKPISTSTGSLLQDMLNIHRPKIWVFGHYHQNFVKEVHGTLFVCLNELGVLQFDKNLNFFKK
jgi:predicted phosphodiesterase